MARARSDKSMSMEELCAAMDDVAPWPPSSAYVGDGGAKDWELYAEAARRRAEVALRLGVVDRFTIFVASGWRDRL